MLSRAAERVYWAGRYLERAENTARIVQQYSQSLLDIPEEAGVSWHELAKIFGATSALERQNLADNGDNERTILQMLLSDADSGSSLIFSIKMTRENIRNSRDLLPQESWENVNELYQFALRRMKIAAEGEDRFDLLSDCIGRCQQINGVLKGTMSKAKPYQFLMLGQNLERADMTSRIIDVAAAYLQQNERLVLRYGSTLWTNVLKAVSGFQMYRQYCQPEVEGLAAIDFLLNDAQFPRAARACIDMASRTVEALPRSEILVEKLKDAETALPSPLPEGLDGEAVSQLMDTLQKRLADAHVCVVQTWFLPTE